MFRFDPFQTLKRRYFVLRSSSSCGKSRLEYYESEKKFRSKAPPKRLIHLASCFNIAQKDDTRHKFVFALYTREDVFGLICESHEELKSWLDALLKEQRTNENVSGNGE
jgi:insulin receptor substrate 1